MESSPLDRQVTELYGPDAFFNFVSENERNSPAFSMSQEPEPKENSAEKPVEKPGLNDKLADIALKVVMAGGLGAGGFGAGVA